ncbi:MAG: winged helix-turn-helix transcriptional regulator [Candidatus Thorarchaeota archaeon]
MSNNLKLETIIERYEEAIGDPIKYGIITSLSWYGILNLTKIAKHINKHESTTFRYIKRLIEEGIIEIDIEKTTSEWGKYYRLTNEVKKIYDMKIKEFENFGELIINNQEFRNKSEKELNEFSINELLEKDFNKEDVLNYLSLQHNIQSAIMNEILNRREEFKKFYLSKKGSLKKEDIRFKPCDFVLLTNTFKISKNKHLIKYYETLYRFQNELKGLITDIEQEMNEEKVPEEDRITQIVHVFSSNTEFLYSINEKK